MLHYLIWKRLQQSSYFILTGTSTTASKIGGRTVKGTNDLSVEATIRDVAREAGVSVATVSRVINGKDHVTPEKHARVVQAMGRLGYVMNQHARSLAGGKSQVIGLLLNEISHPFIEEVIRGIEDELAKSQYDILLYTTHRRKTRETMYVTTLTRGLADGLLLIVPRDIDTYATSLQERHFPHVLIGNETSNGNSSVVNGQFWQGAYTATRYLLQLGHRRIGFIMGIPDIVNAREQLSAYFSALREHEVPIDDALVQPGDYIQTGGYLSAQRLLDLPSPPTAIFAANDLSAFGVMNAARERGLSIPDDLSIIGFDDLPQAALQFPPLTTIHQPVQKMGAHATRLLLELIEQPDQPPQHIKLPTHLVERGTCRHSR